MFYVCVCFMVIIRMRSMVLCMVGKCSFIIYIPALLGNFKFFQSIMNVSLCHFLFLLFRPNHFNSLCLHIMYQYLILHWGTFTGTELWVKVKEFCPLVDPLFCRQLTSISPIEFDRPASLPHAKNYFKIL